LHYEKFADGTVKCIEDEIPFELPEGWAWCRLREIFNVCSAKRVLQSEWKTDGVPFYRAREIVKLANNGYVDNELFISHEHYENLKETYGVPQTGDLMVTGVGTIGKVHIVREDDVFYYKDASVLCFENRYGVINSEYARIMIDSSLLQEQIHSQTYGNTVDTITISTANNYLCILPPISEQSKIVQSVKAAICLIDKIEGDNKEIRNTISLIKSKVLDLAIRGKLVSQNPDDEPASVLLERIRAEKEELIKQGKIKRDKKESIIFKGDDNSYYEKIGNSAVCIDHKLPFTLPDGWTWCVLPEIAKIVMGSSPDGTTINNSNEGIEFHQGKIFFTSKMLNPSDKSTTQPSKIAPKDSVLLCVRAPVGELNITDRSVCIGRGLSSIHPYHYIDAEWLFYWLQTYKGYLNMKATGSTFVAITADIVKTILIPLPPLKEQEKILKTINKVFFIVDLIEKSLR